MTDPPRPPGGKRDLMPIRACVSLLIAGGVLVLAVRGSPGFLDTRVAGAILVAVGAAGLWPHGGSRLVRVARDRLRQVLEETARCDGTRACLDDLLTKASPPTRGRSSAARPDSRDVWAPPEGHDIYCDHIARSDHRAG